MYSIWVPIVAGIIIIVLSVAWNLYFTSYLKKGQHATKKTQVGGIYGVLEKVKPITVMCLCIVCPILLANSDDKVADALNHIKPSKHIDNILENINEQARI